MNLYNIINTNRHSQAGILEQERSVGGDCYHTIDVTFKMKFQFYFVPMVGAMAIAPYEFFNVKIYKNHRILKCQI